jgi:hypothetical protein
MQNAFVAVQNVKKCSLVSLAAKKVHPFVKLAAA